MEYRVFEIGRLQLLTGIRFNVKTEWLRDLKQRWKEDDEQRQRELANPPNNVQNDSEVIS